MMLQQAYYMVQYSTVQYGSTSGVADAGAIAGGDCLAGLSFEGSSVGAMA